MCQCSNISSSVAVISTSRAKEVSDIISTYSFIHHSHLSMTVSISCCRGYCSCKVLWLKFFPTINLVLNSNKIIDRDLHLLKSTWLYALSYARDGRWWLSSHHSNRKDTVRFYDFALIWSFLNAWVIRSWCSWFKMDSWYRGSWLQIIRSTILIGFNLNFKFRWFNNLNFHFSSRMCIISRSVYSGFRNWCDRRQCTELITLLNLWIPSHLYCKVIFFVFLNNYFRFCFNFQSCISTRRLIAIIMFTSRWAYINLTIKDILFRTRSQSLCIIVFISFISLNIYLVSLTFHHFKVNWLAWESKMVAIKYFIFPIRLNALYVFCSAS